MEAVFLLFLHLEIKMESIAACVEAADRAAIETGIQANCLPETLWAIGRNDASRSPSFYYTPGSRRKHDYCYVCTKYYDLGEVVR